MGYEIDFLPADKHKNFLQGDGIILGMCSQACPKYPKQQVYNISAISQGKREGWSWFLPADSCQRFFKVIVSLDVCGYGCSNYTK